MISGTINLCLLNEIMFIPLIFLYFYPPDLKKTNLRIHE
jgi:hypothetical protein